MDMKNNVMLIYADENREDIGVLEDYSFDMCYGDEDNTFELKVQSDYHVCGQDYYVYIEFTEYGGKIDRIESDTKNGEITYKGRTWHGILNSYVIEPPAGYTHRTFYGTANSIVQQIINLFGLGNLFEVDATMSQYVVNIGNFQVRYEKAYDAILRMLREHNGKIKFMYKAGKVYVYVDRINNYTAVDYFDSSQVPFKVGRTYNPVNHLICLGQGNGKDRAVIHLFAADKSPAQSGINIQPYILHNPPLEDSDYILDKRNQKMFGLDEITAIFDYPNAEIFENFKQLLSQPSDWNTQYHNKYYQLNANKEYELVPKTVGKHFTQVFGTQPPDWAVESGYKNYYYVDNTGTPKYVNVKALSDSQAVVTYPPMDASTGYTNDFNNNKSWRDGYRDYYYYDSSTLGYKPVEAEDYTNYVNYSEKPEDWETNYSSYKIKEYDGTKDIYTRSPQGWNFSTYVKQDRKPTNWDANWGSYYVYVSSTYSVGNIAFLAVGYYTCQEAVDSGFLKRSGSNPPKWKKNTFYTAESSILPPDFAQVKRDYPYSNGVWKIVTGKQAPTFVADGRYHYRKVDNTPPWDGTGVYWVLDNDQYEFIPNFRSRPYYYRVYDRMKALVEAGVKKLQELCDTDSLDVNLELTEDYDVGDIVGSKDNVTGMDVNKAILRKIIKIKKGLIEIEHQVE